MYTLVRNVLLVVALVVVALVLVRAAQHGDGPAVPAASIQSKSAGTGAEQELPPRVLQVSPATEERGGVSPVAPLSLDGASDGELNPTGRPSSPVPRPMALPGAVEIPGLADETLTNSVATEYPLPTLAEPQPTPPAEAVPQEPPPSSDLYADAADPPAQNSSRIITGPDDSFWSISQRAYGSRAYYRALFRHNRNQVLRPDQLKAGIQIEIPPLETLRSLYPNDCPPDGSDS